MSVKWTQDQQKVIHTRGSNILVSAAAGSGKTAVLVERIITRLTKDKNPIDVDKLLIVTFTEAAAAEMKERILSAIEKALIKDPSNVHLQRQTMLIHNATITTTHSFCLSIMNSYFYAIDLEPGYRTADQNEIELIKEDVFDKILEREYEKETKEFLGLLESMVSGRSDKSLGEFIISLYNYSRSYAQPEVWLGSCVQMYDISSNEQFDDSLIAQYGTNLLLPILKEVYGYIKMGKDIIDSSGAEIHPEWIENFYEQDKRLCEILNNPTMSFINTKIKADIELHSMKLSDLKVPYSRVNNKAVHKEIKGYYDKAMKLLKGLEKDYLAYEMAEPFIEILQCKSKVQEIVRLVNLFAGAFQETKRAKNIIDYNDMEHGALTILTKNLDGKLVPSDIAQEYQNKFEEIMIDEYQDSNEIQDTIISMVSKVHKVNPEYNIFMVGDVKQSIYSFRQSKPELFMEKLKRYDSEGDEIRIDLSMNFRSRSQVLEGCNHVFEKIMHESLGKVEYDQDARLNVGASFEELAVESSSNNNLELLLLDLEGQNKEFNKHEMEARSVAKRINELIGEHQIIDKETNEFRKLKFSDIVILSRVTSSKSGIYYKILEEEGIPLDLENNTGYFQTWEIGLLLEYLKVVDNPKQDIPLAAVLSSVFGGLTSEELAVIATTFKGVKFHNCVYKYAYFSEKDQEKLEYKNSVVVDNKIQLKLKKCLDQIDKFRDLNSYSSVYELLYRIIEDTGFKYYVLALESGEQRGANVEELLQKAITFERTSFKGLFNYIRYIEKLKKYKKDTGEAQLSGDKGNSVRFMSIHKSKGLEFPVVFLVGTGNDFSAKSISGEGIVHPILGLGMNYMDVQERSRNGTFHRDVIKKQIKIDEKGEELRLLYVAMTRAKEKLILSASVNDFYKKLKDINTTKKGYNSFLSFNELSEGNSYLDWILPCFCYHKHFDYVWHEYSERNILETAGKVKEGQGFPIHLEYPERNKEIKFNVNLVKLADIKISEATNLISDKISKEIFLVSEKNIQHSVGQLSTDVVNRITFKYAYENEMKIKSKISVTELKNQMKDNFEGEHVDWNHKIRKKDEFKKVIPIVPQFMMEKNEEFSAMERGNAFHRFMEIWPFHILPIQSDIEEFINANVNSGKFEKAYSKYLNIDDIMKFFESDLAIRMYRAAVDKNLFKEQPFVTHFPLQRVYGEEFKDSQESVLLQGIIDVYFEEEDGIVVVDYKTDNVKSEKELTERYREQLEFYSEALENITKKKIKEKRIYSFKLNKDFNV